MSTTTRLVTADELLSMPHRDERGNDCRLELIRGEVKKMSLTGGTHGILCAQLAMLLYNFVHANGLGAVFGAETGFQVERDPDSVLGIDAAFVSAERMKSVQNLEKFLPFAPDLAVELLSPSNTAGEMKQKVALYFGAGSRVVWIINPKRRNAEVYSSPTEVRVLTEPETLDGGDVLPGFELKLSELFGAVKQ